MFKLTITQGVLLILLLFIWGFILGGSYCQPCRCRGSWWSTCGSCTCASPWCCCTCGSRHQTADTRSYLRTRGGHKLAHTYFICVKVDAFTSYRDCLAICLCSKNVIQAQNYHNEKMWRGSMRDPAVRRNSLRNLKLIYCTAHTDHWLFNTAFHKHFTTVYPLSPISLSLSQHFLYITSWLIIDLCSGSSCSLTEKNTKERKWIWWKL